jgi:hypothetical protein
MNNPVAGDATALRSAVVMRGVNSPLADERNSNIADGDGVMAVSLMPTPCDCRP